MSDINRATTPTLSFFFPEEVQAGSVTALKLSFAQNGRTLMDFTERDVEIDTDNNIVALVMTQEQTARFLPTVPIEIQFRCRLENEVIASNIMQIDAGRVLNSEVL